MDVKMPSGIITELTKLCGQAVAVGAGMGAWKLPKVEYTQAELETLEARTSKCH